jgi:hypothetical protein
VILEFFLHVSGEVAKSTRLKFLGIASVWFGYHVEKIADSGWSVTFWRRGVWAAVYLDFVS